MTRTGVRTNASPANPVDHWKRVSDARLERIKRGPECPAKGRLNLITDVVLDSKAGWAIPLLASSSLLCLRRRCKPIKAQPLSPSMGDLHKIRIWIGQITSIFATGRDGPERSRELH